MSSSGSLEVGRIDKAHGLAGEVVVSLVTNRLERVEPGAVLDADGVALAVVSARPHQHRWIVRFDGIADREGADALRGTVLRAGPIDDPDALWVHELVGAEVVELSGRSRGRVVAIEANPASDLLVLDTGALVPLRFMVGDPRDGQVIVDAPAGLFDDEPTATDEAIE